MDGINIYLYDSILKSILTVVYFPPHRPKLTTLIIKAHNKGFRKQFSEDIYAGFLGEVLKGNEYLGQNLVTGIQCVVKESIFSELNNITVYTVLDEIYASYFGLTEHETNIALESAGLSLTDDVKS